ncbi:MAG: TerC/Alx family metal homeostasis membrane protein [Bacteroidia bacterium]|nr:TerC/Alx family metal homeostasis membrane protein [Bacteroidia bacterium]
MSINEFLFFVAFLSFILSMLAIDLGIFNKSSRTVSFRDASLWSFIWVTLAICFSFMLKNYGEKIHGIDNYTELQELVDTYIDDKDELAYLSPDDFERSLQSYRDNMALKFITGWLLEYSLSVDNIFVIILIFTSFGVKESYYKKVLLWGILGAIVMRFIFIFLGAALIQQFHWIFYVFGILLIYSGVKMFYTEEEERIEPDKHPVVRFASRYFLVFPRYVKDRFFVFKRNKLFVTPLFVVVLIVEFTDLLFAIDSVPAIFGVTKDPYLVFFSNIFAVLGLRSMFFFLSNILHLFHYLKTGLSFLLIFIGVKMLAYEWLKLVGFNTQHSLIVILSILMISVVASLLFPKKKKK